MYIPKQFEEKDIATMVQFIRQYPFAILISQVNGRPWATHLPFVVEHVDGETKLLSHLAKANPQWQSLDEQTEALVVFSQPHAYISPALYTHQQNVPTWNYLAVHAYGKPKLHHSKEGKLNILHKAFGAFEATYAQQFEQLGDKYLNGLLDGIVAIEIPVTQLQAKAKLSQNKTAEERNRIIGHLKTSDDPTAADLANFMQQYPYKQD
jgi:transcriptional regulator